MSDLFVLLGQCLLTILSCYVCYLLGERKVSNDIEKKRAEALSSANKAREALRDPAIAERLRDKYKR